MSFLLLCSSAQLHHCTNHSIQCLLALVSVSSMVSEHLEVRHCILFIFVDPCLAQSLSHIRQAGAQWRAGWTMTLKYLIMSSSVDWSSSQSCPPEDCDNHNGGLGTIQDFQRPIGCNTFTQVKKPPDQNVHLHCFRLEFY